MEKDTRREAVFWDGDPSPGIGLIEKKLSDDNVDTGDEPTWRLRALRTTAIWIAIHNN